MRVRPEALAGRTGEVAVGIRPEKIELGQGQANALDGTVVEEAYVGVSTQYIVETDCGRLTVYRQNASPGPERRLAGPTAHAQLEPRLHLRRRLTGGIRMTDALTRRQLLRRAAAGGAFLTVPGVLAACGGSSSKSAATTSSGDKTLAKTLRFSNWTLYIDTNNKKKTSPVAR